jgi:alpha-D-ribose 1-methylphosphonate 5-triphosphate synthase subunit PhnG
MHEPEIHDRNSRFEMIAVCDDATLVGHAEAILSGRTPVEIRQEPTPQLVMQRVREPVQARPFNLGEVLVTAAEVAVDGAAGFAMVPGKAEAKAVSGAIVDAAVEAGHPRSSAIAEDLEAAAATREQRRQREWAESRATTVQFDTMEDEQ